ncbi:hypothetical protein KC19_2G135800 [Ceratodon purpureus]|uniref:Uncharacterized protein n=1 Tax=Ceratodon purpureus TaxID=3225 RepID=A0A8T0IV72_CERPU|nr:hypothetical protein KC19_2G135800 [Ceratodon purpureus]
MIWIERAVIFGLGSLITLQLNDNGINRQELGKSVGEFNIFEVGFLSSFGSISRG